MVLYAPLQLQSDFRFDSQLLPQLVHAFLFLKRSHAPELVLANVHFVVIGNKDEHSVPQDVVLGVDKKVFDLKNPAVRLKEWFTDVLESSCWHKLSSHFLLDGCSQSIPNT